MQRFEQEPEIFFLPFAVAEVDPLGSDSFGKSPPIAGERDPSSFPDFESEPPAGETRRVPRGGRRRRRPDGIPEAAVLARRVPDFLHYLLNDGRPGPTGMLEVHSPPGDEPVQWVTLRSTPSAEEIRAIMEEAGGAACLICGSLMVQGDRMRLAIEIHDAEDDGAGPDALGLEVSLVDPVPALAELARDLAAILGIPEPGDLSSQLTANSGAFFKYLEGLDGAAVLSGDSSEFSGSGEDREALVRPLVEAIRLDPRFGMALRTTAMTLAVAVHGDRLTHASCGRVVDQCLSCGPMDGEGCVALAEQLVGIGDDVRAQAWLEHATALESPPPRGLESLGVLLANRGRPGDARALWTRGLDEDGNPDFLAHLSRLAFHEGRVADGWDTALRGLRRMREREQRAAEWRVDDLGRGILLRYLSEHCGELEAPDDVVEALLDLCELFSASEKRIELGLCLIQVGEPASARSELLGGLDEETDDEICDRAIRGLLALDVPRFEERFSEAVEALGEGTDHPTRRAAMAWLDEISVRQPAFWPAAVHRADALQADGRTEDAADLLWSSLRTRADQPDLLGKLGEVFAVRGNTKRALECIEQALESRPRDSGLHLMRVTWLLELGRSRDARVAVDRALEVLPEDAAIRSLRERMDEDL